MNHHPALTAGRVAVVTGAASGIGLAAAHRLAALGMTTVIADLPGPALEHAAAALGASAHAIPTDVRDAAQLARLKNAAFALGEVTLLMNNAAIGEVGKPWQDPAAWHNLLQVNLFGVLHGLHAFVPAMLAHGLPAAIVNTGSKQGITTPPGNAAYNVSKGGVKILTEQLAHELRNQPGAHITAHLLIPGATYTGMLARHFKEKPAFTWTPDQVAEALIAGLAANRFYILCEDNETTRDMDARRIRWAADDIIKDRPALSRWHPDYAEQFKTFMAAAGDI